MSAQRVNWAGVVMSTLLYFSIGALWYSPWLFTNPWLRLIGKSFDEVKAHGAAPYEYALVAAVLISYGLERTIRASGIAGPLRGAAMGFAVAIVFATAAAAPG